MPKGYPKKRIRVPKCIPQVDSSPANVGRNLKAQRNACGLTMAQVVKECRIRFGGRWTRASISKHENGKHPPKSVALMWYSWIYECTVVDFYRIPKKLS